MNRKIKIDIVSDVVCPWCLIGYKRFERAITELGIQDKIELEWQPFELNPNMPSEGQNVQEHIAEKYGSTNDEQKISQKRLTDFGAELGFTFNFFDEMKMVNTRDAHILLEYAKEYGKQTELNMRLIEAFYSERKDISKRNVLIAELQEVGLNADEALANLDSDDARYEIQSKESFWQNAGVSSVPTIVFNRKSAVTGAQPVEVFKQVLTDLLNE